MLRDDLTNSVSHLKSVVEKSGIYELVQNVVSTRADGGDTIGNLLNAFQILDNAAPGFTEVDRAIIDIINLPLLYDHKWRADFIKVAVGDRSDRPSPFGTVHEVMPGLFQLTSIAPKIIALLSRSEDDKQEVGKTVDHTIDKANDSIIVTIPNLPEKISSASRLASALSAFDTFYQIIEELSGHEPKGLVVAWCDSGSPIQINLRGAGKFVAEVKSIVQEVWNRVVYFKSNEANSKLEVIKNSLPILSKINEMVESGEISPQKGHMLIRQLDTAVDGFVQSGALTKDIEEEREVTALQLMQSNQVKMLTAPVPIIAASDNGSTSRKATLKATMPKKTQTRKTKASSANKA